MLDWSSFSSLGDTLVLAVLEQEERLRAVQERDALRRDGNYLADMQPVKAVFQLALALALVVKKAGRQVVLLLAALGPAVIILVLGEQSIEVLIPPLTCLGLLLFDLFLLCCIKVRNRNFMISNIWSLGHSK